MMWCNGVKHTGSVCETENVMSQNKKRIGAIITWAGLPPNVRGYAGVSPATPDECQAENSPPQGGRGPRSGVGGGQTPSHVLWLCICLSRIHNQGIKYPLGMVPPMELGCITVSSWGCGLLSRPLRGCSATTTSSRTIARTTSRTTPISIPRCSGSWATNVHLGLYYGIKY